MCYLWRSRLRERIRITSCTYYFFSKAEVSKYFCIFCFSVCYAEIPFSVCWKLKKVYVQKTINELKHLVKFLMPCCFIIKFSSFDILLWFFIRFIHQPRDLFICIFFLFVWFHCNKLWPTAAYCNKTICNVKTSKIDCSA